MSLHFGFPGVERDTLTPSLCQERLTLGDAVLPEEGEKKGFGRVVNFLKDMVDAAITGAQMFSSLSDPRKWRQ